MDNNQQLIQQIEQFGFKMMGYDETNKPLFRAPNGQIVSFNTAYNFVKTQIEQASGSGPEGIPDMPVMTNIPNTNIEGSLEKEATIEKTEKQPDKKAEQQTNSYSLPTPIPQVQPPQVKQPEKSLPFGAGFKPKTFNPADVNQVVNFINKNSNKSNTTSNKWLALLFEKFLDEAKSGKI